MMFLQLLHMLCDGVIFDLAQVCCGDLSRRVGCACFVDCLWAEEAAESKREREREKERVRE